METRTRLLVFAICVSLFILIPIISLSGILWAAPQVAPPAQEPTPTHTLADLQIPEIQALGQEAQSKIEPLLLKELVLADRADFFIWMAEQADLSPAVRLLTKEEKGRFVYDTLRETAERTQEPLRRELDRQGLAYRPFFIANKVLVLGGNASQLASTAVRSDVARITANHTFQLQEPIVNAMPQARIAALEANLTFVNADDVWAMGYTGSGTVLAGNDTGLNWDHPALINQYRGWDGSAVDHNYNWWDATGTYPSVPADGHGHGTHTTGTMVGDDGGENQIGMAPNAQTIHCKNMTDGGGGSDATFTECFEWDLAPWDLNGANPRPDLAPDAINNSWSYSGGNNPVFEDEVAALQAAGILVEFSAGNDGPGCASLGSPGDYRQSLTTGSVNHTGGSLPGTLTWFSSRGPSDLYPADYIPDVMAPGENIRSCLPGNNYASWSGTSM
ncbi:MAG: S8 family serine peptidase, partial [Anaerolineae bacterium]|nr:S8 family serine peptidase [Anaerolineae bacterium]